MANALPVAAQRELHRLFAQGTCAGLSDAQLLERFTADRDGPAFEALVIRHGPMVLAVCRRILGNRDNAEDAFQATFLILARRASSIRGAGLDPWLRRVAARVAIQANAQARRRRQSEGRAGAARVRTLPSHEAQADLHCAVHDELERLPENWRQAVVLCDLEGKTHAQAAAELRWGEATVRRRLAAARGRLRSRLARQGIAPLAVVMGVADPRRASAAVPKAWVVAAAQAALGLGDGRGAGLAAAVLSRTTLTALKTTAAGLLVLAGLGLAVAGQTATGPESASPPAHASKTSVKQSRPPARVAPALAHGMNSVTIQGRVLDPDGRPRAWAKLYLGGPSPEGYGFFTSPHPLRTTSGPDGRFRFEVDRDELAGISGATAHVVLAALAEGTGPAWVRLEPNLTEREQTPTLSLTLRTDDRPLTGRVLDPEGRPIAGAEVAVHSLIAAPDDDLPAWLRVLQNNDVKAAGLRKRVEELRFPGGPGLLPRTRTQSDGRFRLVGVGRDRIVAFVVTAPGIHATFRHALTTDDPGGGAIYLPSENRLESTKLQTSGFDVVALPGRTLSGIVRDDATGEPIPGIRVRDADGIVQAITDDQGRYLFAGYGKHGTIQFTADPLGPPYRPTERIVRDAPAGAGPITADVALKRGVWIEGRVVDRATRRPVKADVAFFPLDHHGLNGPNEVDDADARVPTDALGRYHVVGAPGRGVLAVQARGESYQSAPSLKLTPEAENQLRRAYFFQLRKDHYHGLAAIDASPGPGPFTHDFTLETGRPQPCKVVGPDGAPTAGATVIGLRDARGRNRTLQGADFTYVHPNPGKVETLLVTHRARRLGGTLDVTGDEAGPLRVSLAPTGTVVGRLVDSDGRPRPHILLLLSARRRSLGRQFVEGTLTRAIVTDEDGRFRCEDLIPNVAYDLEVVRRHRPLKTRWWTIQPGESEDWGDVRESAATEN